MSGTMDDIVRVEAVTKTFRNGEVEVHALREVSLAIGKGEFSAIAGPSGSGKTTLLNLIGGLDDVSGGAIHVDGLDITTLSPSDLSDLRLRKLGFVFQAYNLIPVLTAYENAEFVLLLQGVDPKERKARVEEVLVDVGLEDQMERRPGEMSGGQQQRVAVARAIVTNPALVLADEPTANLDSKTGAGLLDMMHVMNRERGVTFLFSTHDRMVMERAERIVRLRDGRVERDERREGADS